MGRALLDWDEWNPGLDTDDMTLRAVLDTLPAAAAEDVPEIIRKYENPESPDALPGAIALARHDCIHVLLGRGLHVQDEAFVIGATMGAASDIADEGVHRRIRDVRGRALPEGLAIQTGAYSKLPAWRRVRHRQSAQCRPASGPAGGCAVANHDRGRDPQAFRHREGRAARLFPQGRTAGAGHAGQPAAGHLGASAGPIAEPARHAGGVAEGSGGRTARRLV